jgi:hypothetical protein
MAIPVWPADMPQCVQAPDFEGRYPDARLKTQMDRGPAKYRLGTSAAPIPVHGVIPCTLDQLACGDRFWREALQGGTLPFIFLGQALNNTPPCDESGDPLTDESDASCAQGRQLIVAVPPLNIGDVVAHNRDSVALARKLHLEDQLASRQKHHFGAK